MKYIKTYKTHRLIEKDFNRKINFFNDIELVSSDEKIFIQIFNKYLDSYNVNESIKIEIRSYIEENQILNEGFFDKLKERFPNAAKVSNKLSGKAKSVLNKVLQSSKNAISFIKKIGDGIKEIFVNGINKGKEIFEKIINNNLKQKIDQLVNNKKDGLIKDLKVIKGLITFYRKDFLSNLNKKKRQKMTDFLSNNQVPIKESSINESGNVIATLVHGLETIPPFSWLHNVAQAGEAGATKLISAISDLTEKLGGPSFQLPVIALLIGVVIEQIVKGQVGGWLITLAGTTTPLALAITGIKTVALFIAFIVSIDAIIGEKILGGHHSEKEDIEDEKNAE